MRLDQPRGSESTSAVCSPNLGANPSLIGRAPENTATRLGTLMARWKLLPESWLFGLADVRSVANVWPSYVFGKIYAHGVWFYFPVAFVIKATLTTLIFLPLIVYAIATRELRGWREILFLSLPPALYFGVSMTS